MRIAVRSFQIRPIIDAAELRHVVEQTLRATGERADSVSFVFVDDSRMSDYHGRYVDVPEPTDVLSFPADQIDPSGERDLGDVVICTDQAARQARRAARRLSEWPVAAVHSSDLVRAVETAEIIADKLGSRVRRTPLLREVLPTRVQGLHVPLAKRAASKESLEEILGRYFRRARCIRHEVIVCHGNLIRALMCHALAVRLTVWSEMGAHHCGITRFVVRQDGSVRLLCSNDIGHLPPTMITM